MNIKDKQSVIDFVEQNGLYSRRYHRKYDILHLACERGDLDTVKYLLDKGADTESVDTYGFKCLHVAAMNGNLKVVKYLIEEVGIPVDQRTTKSNFTPLYLSTGYLDTLKYLESKGADFKATSISGETVLATSMLNSIDVIKYLLLGDYCDVTAADNDGETALHKLASRDDSYENFYTIIRLMADKGADLDAKSHSSQGTSCGHSLYEVQTPMSLGFIEKNQDFVSALDDVKNEV